MSLTNEELQIIQSLGYSETVCDFVKVAAKNSLERIILTEWVDDKWAQRPGDVIAVLMPRSDAEQFVRECQPRLMRDGYMAFASERRNLRGGKAGEELVLLKTTDPYDIIRIQNTYAYEFTIEEIIGRLNNWASLCEFRLLGAGPDWLSLDLLTLPQDILSFAFDVYQFCPEGVGEFEWEYDEQGTPTWYAEVDAALPGRIEKAYQTPKGKLDPERALLDEKCAKGVALGLRSSSYQFFWWD